MMKKIALTTTLLVSVLTLPVMAKDTLRLKNGDVLSGEITGYSPAGAQIQTSYGVFDIPVSEIGGIESPKVSMQDIAPPAPAPEPVEAKTTPELLPIPDDIASTEPAAGLKADDTATLWGAKWSGNINAGAELETGNSDSESYALDGESRLNWDDVHRWTLGADYEREKENDVEVSDEYEFYTAYDYFFADKWFWNNGASYEVDNIESLDSRIEATTGLGYQFYDEDDLSLEVTFGPGYQREEYSNQDAEDSMTANWTLDYEQGFYDDTVRLFHNQAWVAPTDEMSSWLFDSASGVKVPLKAGIVATGEVDFDYNNEPPIGEGEDDTTYRLKLGYEWP